MPHTSPIVRRHGRLTSTSSSSKDGMINIWNLPNPPADTSRFAEAPGQPSVVDYFAKTEHRDPTSLHWNADGTLLAVGSYDAVIRICSTSGTIYFSNPQHSVNKSVFYISRASDFNLLLLRRAPFSQRDFPNPVVGFFRQVWMALPAYGM